MGRSQKVKGKEKAKWFGIGVTSSKSSAGVPRHMEQGGLCWNLQPQVWGGEAVGLRAAAAPGHLSSPECGKLCSSCDVFSVSLHAVWIPLVHYVTAFFFSLPKITPSCLWFNFYI